MFLVTPVHIDRRKKPHQSKKEAIHDNAIDMNLTSNETHFKLLSPVIVRDIAVNPTGINFGWTCSRQPQETETQLLLDNCATDVENMDNIRVVELNQLSEEARERAQEEVHCVVDDLAEEEPEHVERLLAQMEEEISKNRKKFACDRALFFSPSYVRDRNFALAFLRSTHFHPSKAAECMIAHFELKLESFGLECLARAVTLEDLNKEDISTLAAGNCQCLSEKDRGGRAVFCGLHKVQQNATRASTAVILEVF
jgi:hypothetical protein